MKSQELKPIESREELIKYYTENPEYTLLNIGEVIQENDLVEAIKWMKIPSMVGCEVTDYIAAKRPVDPLKSARKKWWRFRYQLARINQEEEPFRGTPLLVDMMRKMILHPRAITPGFTEGVGELDRTTNRFAEAIELLGGEERVVQEVMDGVLDLL